MYTFFFNFSLTLFYYKRWRKISKSVHVVNDFNFWPTLRFLYIKLKKSVYKSVFVTIYTSRFSILCSIHTGVYGYVWYNNGHIGLWTIAQYANYRDCIIGSIWIKCVFKDILISIESGEYKLFPNSCMVAVVGSDKGTLLQIEHWSPKLRLEIFKI